MFEKLKEQYHKFFSKNSMERNVRNVLPLAELASAFMPPKDRVIAQVACKTIRSYLDNKLGDLPVDDLIKIAEELNNKSKVEDDPPEKLVNESKPQELRNYTTTGIYAADHTIEAVNKSDNDLSFVNVWYKINIKDWPITTKLSLMRDGNILQFSYDKSMVWEEKEACGKENGLLNANLWIIVNNGGIWTASTFEWARKRIAIIKDLKILTEELEAHSGIKVKLNKGDKIYLMVSGLCRNAVRNVEERSNIVEFII